MKEYVFVNSAHKIQYHVVKNCFFGDFALVFDEAECMPFFRLFLLHNLTKL